MKFNRLTVLGSTEERKNKGTLWECRCDCGTIVKLLRYDITSGRVKSCGCLQREVSSELCKKRAKDITGQKFGKLTALRPTEERRATCTVWECRCDCGNTVLVAIQDLTSGHTRSCGCLTAESGAKRAKDLTGQRFGRLVALHPTDKRMGTYVVWECQCDCGNLTTAPSGDLLAGDRVSCGCILMENARRLNETQDRADGTNIDMLKTGKLRSNNRTGQTGVTITNTGKFQAYIGFQGKCYHLGFYKKLEDAVAVRKKAESLLHDETIDYYARWKEMAEKDPG